MKYQRVGNNLVVEFSKEYCGITIAAYLDSLLVKQTKDFISGIRVNRQVVGLDYELQANDNLALPLFEDQDVDFIIDPIEIDVVYEDELLLIVNKPANIMVHPDDKSKQNTLANRVAYYYICNGINTTVRHLHRLDTATVGLVMFCKCPKLQPLFDKMIQTKEIHRYYLAVVEGYLRKNSKIVVDAKIGRDRHNAKKYLVSSTGKDARTHIKCIKTNIKGKYSLVECVLDTGRTHQIRVHMVHLKHPIVNDELYGSRYLPLSHLALQAYRLEFIHPISKDVVDICISMDNEMKTVFEL